MRAWYSSASARSRCERMAPARRSRAARSTTAAIAAAKAALAGDLEPIGDLHASAATKLHLAGVLTGRVLRQLAAEVR